MKPDDRQSKVGKPDIRLKRVYEAADAQDGFRILVDRIWPRGLSKEKAGIDYWAKQSAPSKELRKWYGHDPEKWEAFKQYYFNELDSKPEAVRELIRFACQRGRVTFVYSSREREWNNAAALKAYTEQTAECEG